MLIHKKEYENTIQSTGIYVQHAICKLQKGISIFGYYFLAHVSPFMQGIMTHINKYHVNCVRQ